MIPFLFLEFQIPILLLLVIGAYQDYKSRTVSNEIIAYIASFAIAILFLRIILGGTNVILQIFLMGMFLCLFYFTNQIGGADTKVFILLLPGMTQNEIFIFFFLFSVTNLILVLKFWKGIPLFISILFGYSGVILLSILPILIRIVFGT